MKAKIGLAVLSLAAALAATPAFAGGWGTSGYTGLGYIDEDELDDDAFSSSSSLVYFFNDVLGVEGGYTGFGDFENKFNVIEGQAKVKSEVDGWHIGMHATIPMGSPWYFTGRIGMWAWDGDFKLEVPGSATIKASDDGVDLYAGAAIGYKFTERWGAGLGATYFSTDVNGDSTGLYILGINTEYRF